MSVVVIYEMDLSLLVDATPSQHNVSAPKEAIDAFGDDWTAAYDGTFELTLNMQVRKFGFKRTCGEKCMAGIVKKSHRGK